MDNKENTNSSSLDESDAGIVVRPPFQLRSLPIRYRWEVTRRHPYYQLSWRRAQSHHRQEECQHPVEGLLRQMAVIHLAAIGISGEPPDPATDFEQLEQEQMNAAWASGACHPISFRGMAALLMSSLPKETLASLGTMLTESSREDHEDEPPHRIKILIDLQTLDKPGLELYPDEPLVSINPAASARQIEEAASTLLKEWKLERGLSERRDRTDKYDDYLGVWDLREGWDGGTYDRTKERRLRHVAGELRLSPTTVHNRYCSAFSLIVGRSYSPELWYRVFGPLKLSLLFGGALGDVSRRRPLKSRTPVPVAESIVSPDVVSRYAAPNVGGYWELLQDIQSEIAKGLTDHQIVESLDLSPAMVEAIAVIRERGDDQL